MAYLQLPIDLNLDSLIQRAVARIKLRHPGYRFDTASLDAAILEELTRLSIQDRQTMVVMAAEAFSEFGRHELDTPMITAQTATVAVTVTATSATGHLIPDGQLIVTLTGADQPTAFRLDEDLDIPVGETTAVAVLTATVPGAHANGLGPGAARLVQAPASVASVTATAVSAGGVDAETGAQFRDRMSGETRLLLRVPTKGWQYEIAARRIPGVHRALARERYNAATATEAGGHVTVAAVDIDGVPVDAATRDLLEVELTDPYRRIVNVTVHVIDAALQAVAVNYSAVTQADADPALVKDAADAALFAHLNPAVYGGGGEDPPVWRHQPMIRHQDLSTILNNVPGLDYWTTLTINGGTADVELVGIAVLPDPTITGEVLAP